VSWLTPVIICQAAFDRQRAYFLCRGNRSALYQ
jgi:hypothetical protein